MEKKTAAAAHAMAAPEAAGVNSEAVATGFVVFTFTGLSPVERRSTSDDAGLPLARRTGARWDEGSKKPRCWHQHCLKDRHIRGRYRGSQSNKQEIKENKQC